MSVDQQMDLLSFPAVHAVQIPQTALITNAFFNPLARRLESTPGLLVERIEFGAFALTWDV